MCAVVLSRIYSHATYDCMPKDKSMESLWQDTSKSGRKLKRICSVCGQATSKAGSFQRGRKAQPMSMMPPGALPNQCTCCLLFWHEECLAKEVASSTASVANTCPQLLQDIRPQLQTAIASLPQFMRNHFARTVPRASSPHFMHMQSREKHL